MTKPSQRMFAIGLPLFFLVFYLSPHTYFTLSTIEGANMYGVSSTILNVGGNLHVASLQERHTQKSVGADLSVSYVKNDDPHVPSKELGTLGKTTFKSIEV